MLFVPGVNQSVMVSPPIAMDDVFRLHLTPDYCLQHDSSIIWNNLCIDFPLRLKIPKTMVLPCVPLSRFPFIRRSPMNALTMNSKPIELDFFHNLIYQIGLYIYSDVGMWLSLVEHSVRDAGVGGSNPLIPTISNFRSGMGKASIHR